MSEDDVGVCGRAGGEAALGPWTERAPGLLGCTAESAAEHALSIIHLCTRARARALPILGQGILQVPKQRCGAVMVLKEVPVLCNCRDNYSVPGKYGVVHNVAVHIIVLTLLL